MQGAQKIIQELFPACTGFVPWVTPPESETKTVIGHGDKCVLWEFPLLLQHSMIMGAAATATCNP